MAADSILTGEKYFGKDSINITKIAEVQYIVKFSGNPSKTSFGIQNFLEIFEYEKTTRVIKNGKESLSG
jgi:hypothetical protein